jgi:3-hydroxybutyryl-CoA dehydrogenase
MSEHSSEPTIQDTLILPYLNHAVRMYEERYASRADIDAAMRFGCGYPAGPLTVLDTLGLDVARDRLAARYEESGDALHKPAGLLERLVEEGRTGVVARRGFYTYDESGAVAADDETPSADDAPGLQHDIATVGVVGTGTMASGIVEVFAKAGYDVVYVGRSEDKVAGVQVAVERSLDKAVSRGKLDEEGRSEVLGRLTGATEREALSEVDVVVEAVAEDLEVKKQLFSDLDRICKQGAILASTTSSLPITDCAATTSRPDWVIGMHFFNPAPVMKLVEVVTTEHTSAAVDETTRALCAKVGKVAVSCSDRAGFIVNALLFPYLNDAVKLLESGRASMEEIDTVVKDEAGLPMGPFALLDVVGNDVSLAIEEQLLREFGEPGLEPAKTLRDKVTAGELGRKTKQGFYDYR